MESREGQSSETVLLDANPGLRDTVGATPAFQQWLAGLVVTVIDGETLYVFGGDQLRDLDQCMVAWVRMNAPEWLSRPR